MPPRLSARLAAKVKVPTSSPEALPSAASAGSSSSSLKKRNDTTKQPQKRQKTTPSEAQPATVIKPRKNSKGKGTEQKTSFLKLPLDVFLEIFKYAQPKDLLNLSYTSKELRSVLTADYTERIWKKSYRNLPISCPSCPEGVHIRHYTSVFFGTHCLFCAAPSAKIVHWDALTRLCNLCARKQLIQRNSRGIDPMACSLCWTTHVKSRTFPSGTYILRPDYERHIRMLDQCVDDAAKLNYIDAQRLKKRQNAVLSRRLHYWHTRQADQKKRETQSLREMRCAAIRERLREEGYDSLGKWYWRLDKLPGGNVAAPLTDAAWDKIKFRLLSFFEFQRQDSREKEMIRAFQSRASHLERTLRLKLEKEPKPWIYAPLPTIVNSNILATVIGRDVEGADEIQINTEITHLKDKLPKISMAWRAEADEYLLGLLAGPTKSSADGEAPDATPLELATTFFGCHWCTEAVSYPRILMHECLRTRRQDQDEDVHSDTEGSEFSAQKATTDEGGPDMVHGIPTVKERQVWNKMSSWLGPTWNEAREFISVDEESTKSAKAIIQACGKNPNTLTAEAFNDLNIRVECMRCVPPPGKRGTARSRHVMSWNMAILHDLYMHVDDISAEGWKLVTSETDLARVKEYEDKILRKITVKPYERCRICEATVRSASIDQDSVENPQSHLSKVHKINITTELQDYVYVPLDAPMKAFPRAVII